MKQVNQIIRQRSRRRKQRSAANSTLGLGLAGTISLVVVTIIIATTWFYASLTKDLPSINTIPALLEPPDGLYLKPTIIFDRTGTHPLTILENPAIQKREYLYIDEDHPLPQYVIDAFVAQLDPTFWSHPGFIVRNWKTTTPTITQQLIDKLLLWDEPSSWKRELREKLLAIQLTQVAGRLKILEWYLNNAYFGRMVYGLNSASKVYFGKSPQDLTLGEAALLAAVSEAPALNPHDTPKAAIERQQIVLDNMVEYGFISKEDAQNAKKQPLAFSQPTPRKEEFTKSFTDFVENQVAEIIPPEIFRHGGFQIISTLDYNLQVQAICTQRTLLSRLSENTDEPEKIYGYPCETGRLIQTFPLQSPLPESLSTDIIVYNQNTGEILAMAEHNTEKNPHISTIERPVGNMTTPFIMLTAFTRGYNPASLVWDIPENTLETQPTISNPDGKYHGPIRLRIAFANDYLNAISKVLQQIGENNVIITSQRLGLKSIHSPLLPKGESASLLQLIQAYGTLANQGEFVGWKSDSSISEEQLEPISVKEIIDYSGNIWLQQNEPEKIPILSQQISYLLTNVLSDEVAKWQSLGHPNLLEIGRPTAVKIGNSPDFKNTWTIGYTPQIIIGAWAGIPSEVEEQQHLEISPKISAALWRGMMQYITQDLPPANFPEPPGISTIRVCDPSGMLPTAECPTVVNEIFIYGNEPTQYDKLFQKIRVNRETNRLATVFTPPELIDEITYMIAPPEASEWMKASGLETPPTEYDVIYIPETIPHSNITSPKMFDFVNGKVDIRGTANGSDFISYRVQVGKGLNPTSWILIKKDSHTPVNNGHLATWNTEDYEEGLYAIQLIVLRKGQHLDTATIQITLDNEPPVISIPYPENGENIPYQTGGTLTLRADVSDNTGIAQVRFYLNAKLLDSFTFSPYATPWKMELGDYQLRVVAKDLAGNSSETILHFNIVK